MDLLIAQKIYKGIFRGVKNPSLYKKQCLCKHKLVKDGHSEVYDVFHSEDAGNLMHAKPSYLTYTEPGIASNIYFTATTF